MHMIDIHTHLYFPDFESDRDETVKRAKEAGVGFMMSVGTDPDDNAKAVGIAESYEGVRVSVGLHPHFFNRPEVDSPRIAEEIQTLETWTQHPKVSAIGECGLDYFSRNQDQPITGVRKSRQREGFLAQIGIAKRTGLPLIIHTRSSAGTMDAYEEVFEILSDPQSGDREVSFVLHCYQGDTVMTEKFLSLPGAHFSFAGNLTYPVKKSVEGTKDDIRETVKLVPADRLFVETDCPFLAPQGRRGERNEPAFVRMTAETVARILSISEEELDRQLEQNAVQVFGRR